MNPDEKNNDQTSKYHQTPHERVQANSGGKHKPVAYAAGANERGQINPDPGTAAADEAAKFGGEGFPPAPAPKKARKPQ